MLRDGYREGRRFRELKASAWCRADEWQRWRRSGSGKCGEEWEWGLRGVVDGTEREREEGGPDDVKERPMH